MNDRLCETKIVDGEFKTQSVGVAGVNKAEVYLQIYDSELVLYLLRYSLGSLLFSQTYELPVEVETESFLLTHDESYINNAIRAKLRQTNIHLAALTARPSGPPREVKDLHLGFAPEAEIAFELVELVDIPLIGFGKLEYLAAQRGLDAGALIKPSPVHALATTAAALTGNEWFDFWYCFQSWSI